MESRMIEKNVMEETPLKNQIYQTCFVEKRMKGSISSRMFSQIAFENISRTAPLAIQA